jgi:hypothetical protein
MRRHQIDDGLIDACAFFLRDTLCRQAPLKMAMGSAKIGCRKFAPAGGDTLVDWKLDRMARSIEHSRRCARKFGIGRDFER